VVLAIAVLLFCITPAPAPSAAGEPLCPESWDSALTKGGVNLPDASSGVGNAATSTPSAADPLAPQGQGLPAGGSVAFPVNPASLASAIGQSDSLASLRVTKPDSGKPLRFVSPESLPSRREWIALSVGQHAAATFDAYSTLKALGRGAVEADPLMRPFANSWAMYAAIQVAPVVLDLVARRLQRSQSHFLRRTWWLPQTAATGMFFASGVHNVHVANRLQ
jgi:hypothetical protein